MNLQKRNILKDKNKITEAAVDKFTDINFIRKYEVKKD